MRVHHHLVHFYETDLMGIVHHANYLRIFEESRVDWAVAHGLIDYQQPGSAAHFAVLETWVKHLKPAKFGDQLEVHVQAKSEGARLIFEYKLFCPKKSDQPFSIARTTHVALDPQLKPMRLPEKMRNTMEKEKWNETWLSNL